MSGPAQSGHAPLLHALLAPGSGAAGLPRKVARWLAGQEATDEVGSVARDTLASLLAILDADDPQTGASERYADPLGPLVAVLGYWALGGAPTESSRRVFACCMEALGRQRGMCGLAGLDRLIGRVPAEVLREGLEHGATRGGPGAITLCTLFLAGFGTSVEALPNPC